MAMRPIGFCSVTGAFSADGRQLDLAALAAAGVVRPGKCPAEFALPADELPLGYNLFLDNARQYVAYAMAFRAPVGDYVIQKFGVGTGNTPPNVGDVELQNRVEVTPGSGTYVKFIDSVEFPAPFTAAFNFTLGANDFNGYLIEEVGLYSGNNTLMMRWVLPSGINKDATIALTLRHRVVF